MPTQHDIQKSILVKLTAAEATALLIEALAARHGVTVNQAHLYVIDAEGEQMASPLLVMDDHVVILNAAPVDQYL